MVNNKSFMSLNNLNWIWVMNSISSHEMSYANYLNLNAYIMVGPNPWQNDCNLFVDMHFLFKISKMALNFVTSASKSFRSGD